MTQTEKHSTQLSIWKMEQYDLSKWQQHQASIDNIEEFAIERINAEPKPYNEAGSMTAEKILCSKCSSISDSYRFGYNTSHLEHITETMRKYKSRAPIILFRGVSDIPMDAMRKSAIELPEEDVDFYEKGYMSCSLLAEEASPYKDQLIIYVPPFSHVMYAGHCNDEEEPHCRYECIIMRGAKLKIIKRENNTYYCILRQTV